MSLVHNNPTLSKVQKLHYLKTSLTGEALSLVKHAQVTEVNYDGAFRTLKARFGNKLIIVHSILKKFFAQKKIFTQTANNIKSILDTTSECLNALTNLITSSWNTLTHSLVFYSSINWTQRRIENGKKLLTMTMTKSYLNGGCTAQVPTVKVPHVRAYHAFR